MRMGPFSHPTLIRMLNEYFVPIRLSTHDYIQQPKVSQAEQHRLRAIWRDAKDRGLSQGTVHAYFLGADARVLDSLHVRDAVQLARLLPCMRRVITTTKVQAGKRLVEPPAVTLPPCSPGGLRLRVAAEYDDQPGSVGEDVIVLTAEECRQLAIPSATTRTWQIDRALAEKILIHLCPFSQDWDTAHNRFETCTLHATVVRQRGAPSLVRIRGTLAMHHNRQQGRDPQMVRARIVGTIRYTDGLPQVMWTTDVASFGGRRFSGILVSLPRPESPRTAKR